MAGRFALIIANSRYDDPALSRQAPNVDVRALEEVLKAPEIGHFDEVTTLLDADGAAVRQEIARFVDGRHLYDLLFLYFAGHGVRDERGRFYLAVRDTDRSRPEETAIDSAFIRNAMDRSLSKRQVLVLECRDGNGLEFAGTGNRVILIANSAAQNAWEEADGVGDAERSSFTRSLIEGLRTGSADRDRDGVITTDDLFDYLFEQVTTTSPGQMPGKWTSGSTVAIFIARSPYAEIRRNEAERRADEEARREMEAAARHERERERAELAAAERREIERLRNSRDEQSRRTPPPPVAEHAAARHVDENVQFSVYRPPVVVPERWYPLLAFAHLSERRPDAPPDEPDPIAEVQRQAHQILGADADTYANVTQDSRVAIPIDGQLRIVPSVPGIEFNPRERSFLWTEPVHREEFRLRARRDADGRTVRGTVSVFLDSVLVADVNIAIAVKSGADARPAPIHDVARPYRRIFASYSHRDTAIVSSFEKYARGFGDRYMRDVIDLRAGEVWDGRLAEMIEEADVFQLFWSWNAIGSPFVRSEWEHALKMNRAYFIRPVYWETPFPERGDLPPAALRALHFADVRPFVGVPQAPVPQPPIPQAPPPPPRPFTPPTTMSPPSSGAGGYPGPMPAPPSRPAAPTPIPPLDEEDGGTGDTLILAGPLEAPAPTRGTPPAKSTSMLTIAIAVALLLGFVVAKACFSL